MLLSLFVLDRLFPPALPDATDLYARVVVDRDGRPLRAFPDKNGVWRYATELDELSTHYFEALLNYEDKRFWQHPGIDLPALLRAAVTNIKHGEIVSGGSTLTMQVARLLHPHSKTFIGKLYQIMRALQLEWRLSKKEILTLYCNIAPFGGTIEGVQAASYTYLNKPASQLTRAEAALLAVLPQSPTRYRPDLHPEKATAARNKVLDRMVSQNIWSRDIVEAAKLEKVYAFRNSAEQHAPLLSRKLIREAKDRSLRSVIETTIHGELQRALEDHIKYYIEAQAEKTSAAILVVDNAHAEVLAYVGTAEFGNTKRFGHVDMVQAIRSPGSTLKPFLYALAFDQGLIHSQSLLSDTPQSWEAYRPGNFSGGFSGPVSAQEALQRSLNIPAVALLEKVGPENFVSRLESAGLPLQIPGHKANLSLILGGTGTSLEKLVQAFGMFANGGKVQPLKYLKNANTQPERFFVGEQAAWLTQEILHGVRRPNGLLNVASIENNDGFAWKTGTSYGFRDAWAVGVGKRYTIGVWVGRPDGTPNPGASGRNNAGPLLFAVADYLPGAYEKIVRPKGVEPATICWPLGTLKSEQAEQHCHKQLTAWIINNTVPPTWPDRHRPLQANPFSFSVDAENGRRLHSDCTAKQKTTQSIANWPAELEPWLPQKFRRAALIPKFSEHCRGVVASGDQLSISGLENNSIFQSPINTQRAPLITLQAIGGEGTQHWYVNGKFHHRSQAMATAHLQLEHKGGYQIVVSDQMGNVDKVKIVYR